MRAGSKKGRYLAGSALNSRTFWKNSYFPFFGPLASSFLPFFFIASSFQARHPMGRGESRLCGWDGLTHHATSLGIRVAGAAVKKIPCDSQKISGYCAIPPV